MPFDINNFRSQLVGDGARPAYFEVQMNFPGNVINAAAAGQKTIFMAKAAQLPGSTIGIAPVFYYGREVKLPGNRTFADWTITIINDEDFLIRNAFENWSNLINSHAGNARDASMMNFLGYSTSATVYQYGKDSVIIKQVDFVGMWPVDLAPIDLDWGTMDQIEEWTCTLAYQYWTSTRPVQTTDVL